MAPKTPLILADNILDVFSLYTAGTLTTSSETAGQEAFRVTDARRDRSSWLPTSDAGGAPGNWIAVDLGASVTRGVDYLWLDRGHNLWGKTVTLTGATNAAFTTGVVSQAFVVPAAGTLGGTPAWPSMSVTEEGCVYSVADSSPALAAKRYWRFSVNYVAAFVPLVTGVMFGLKHQLLNFSSVLDEDHGERTQRMEESDAGYRATGTTYHWRTVDISLTYINATEYDTSIRELRRLLFERNQAVAVFMEHGTYPERGWLYQLDSQEWSFAKSKVYRSGDIHLREVGHLLG